MYFGTFNVHYIRRYLDGWRAHRCVESDDDAFADFFFQSFHGFVESYYQDDRTIGWNGLIYENTKTEEEGYKQFMILVRQIASQYSSTKDLP